MRDENRIREKLELSLDSRQVVSLLVGGLLALGVVFVLGVMVGKQLAPVAPAKPADLLSTLDKDTDAGKVALTFQQELTRPAPAAQPAPRAAAKPAEKPAARPEPPAVAEKPAPPAVEPKPEPPPPSPKMDRKLADAFSAAQGSESATPPPAPAPTSGFTVQVAASQQKDDAAAILEKLRAAGLRPYLVEADVPGKGHWYRVRLGAFKTKDDAARYVKDLKRETGFSAFVTNAQ